MLSLIFGNGGWVPFAMFLFVVPYLSISFMMEGRNPERYPILNGISKVCICAVAVLFLIGIFHYDMWC